MHFCPYWLMMSPMVGEVSRWASLSENGNVPVLELPSLLVACIGEYSAGYTKGYKARPKDKA